MSGYVNQILCFLIFLSVLNQLLPNKSYQKYIRLFAGFVLITILLSPLISFDRLDETQIEHYLQSYLRDVDLGDMEAEVERMQEKQEKEGIAELIETRLSMENIQVRKVEVQYGRGEESESIRRIQVVTALSSRKETDTIQRIISEYIGIPLEWVEVR